MRPLIVSAAGPNQTSVDEALSSYAGARYYKFERKQYYCTILLLFLPVLLFVTVCNILLLCCIAFYNFLYMEAQSITECTVPLTYGVAFYQRDVNSFP